MRVHPEFDPATRTWFVPGHVVEAPTLRALLSSFPKGTEFVGYTPDAHYMPPPRSREDSMLNMSKRIEPRTHGSAANKRQIQVAKMRAAVREEEAMQLDDGAYIKPFTTPPRVSAPRRPNSQKGKRYNSDAVLDLWAEGISSMVIAHRLGMNRAENVRTIVQRARAKGDERAVDHAPGRKS